MSALVFAVLALTCTVLAVGLSITDAVRRSDPRAVSGAALIPRAGALLGLVVFLVLAVGSVIV